MGLKPEIVTIMDESQDGQWHKVVIGQGSELSDVRNSRKELQEEFKFNGVKDGMKWKDKVERYFISCAPVLLDVLVWAERQDNELITHDRFQYALSRTMTAGQILNLNAALWGFLSCVVSGSADTMFKRATRLNGIDAWRRLVRHIDHGRELRLNDLRR